MEFRPRCCAHTGGACCSAEENGRVLTQGGAEIRGARFVLPRAMILSPFRAVFVLPPAAADPAMRVYWYLERFVDSSQIGVERAGVELDVAEVD